MKIIVKTQFNFGFDNWDNIPFYFYYEKNGIRKLITDSQEEKLSVFKYKIPQNMNIYLYNA